jgi:hypothetical protein
MSSSSRKYTIAIVAVLIAGGCATNSASPSSIAPEPTPSLSAAATARTPAPSPTVQTFGQAKVVTLATVGTSGVFGTATFWDAGGGTTLVEIKVEANLNRDMIAAIVPSTCAINDETTFLLLNDVRDGVGTTIVPLSVATLFGTQHQIHLHSDPEDHSMAACGDLK